MGSSLIWVKAIKPIDAKTASGTRVFQPGEPFQVNSVKARPLIEKNILREVDPLEAAFQEVTDKLSATFAIWSISGHKKAILAALSRLDDASWADNDLLALQEAIEEIEGLLSESIAEDFSSKNMAVRIHSEILGEEIYLVSNESVRQHLKAEGLVCYLPEEILHMRNIPPEGIKAIHDIKKEFGGNTRVIK